MSGNVSAVSKRDRPRKKRGPGHMSNGGRDTSGAPCMGAQRYFTGQLSEFELFCAYHLGLDEDGNFNPRDFGGIARRFGIDDEGLRSAIQQYRMEPDRVRAAKFDMEMAKIDVEVVPPGIDRVELARTIFQDFLDAGCGVGPVPVWKAPAEPNLRLADDVEAD